MSYPARPFFDQSMTTTTGSTLNAFEAGTNGPMEAVPIGPRPTVITNGFEDQWHNVPRNPHPLYTSPFTGTYLPPTLSQVGYEETDSVVITQPWQAATGDYRGISDHPLQRHLTSKADILTDNTIASSTEGFFETQSGPSYIGIADGIPCSQLLILERAIVFQPENFVFTAEALNTGEVRDRNGNGNHPSFSDTSIGSNNGFPTADRVIESRTNLENSSSLLNGSVKKLEHVILPFMPPEARKTEAYINTFTTTFGRPFFGCRWKGCRGLTFWEHVEAHTHVYEHFLEKGYECACGANFSTELTAGRHCRNKGIIHVCPDW
ncbi:hypothetical protein M422DRAFT_245336 [Sphaerobolus stellatus SS14]|nr:hypothetical protein M422DRAFT_245336 [Sphaerobolus stellatus SS14]